MRDILRESVPLWIKRTDVESLWHQGYMSSFPTLASTSILDLGEFRRIGVSERPPLGKIHKTNWGIHLWVLPTPPDNNNIFAIGERP
jgi:hypothetical protein